jgi:hypothetical protein
MGGEVMNRHLPIEPLRDYVDRRAFAEAITAQQREQGGQAVLLGKDSPIYRAYLRGVQVGYVTWTAADRISCYLGIHPVNVWPDWYEVTESDARQAAS